MDVSIGILFRFSIVILFLTLLAGMFILRLTRKKTPDCPPGNNARAAVEQSSGYIPA